MLVADPLHVRSPAPRPARDDPDAVRPAAVEQHGAVANVARGGHLLGRGLLAGEVAPDPGLALGEERLHEGTCRALPGSSAGHRRDHAAAGVDRDAEAPRPSGPAQGVRQVAAGQADNRGRFDGRGDACHGPGQARRRRRPGRAPVSTPSRIATTPLTITASIPTGWTAGRS